MPSLQDFLAGFDPTGQTTISSADFLNLIQAAIPNVDQGLIITSTDIVSVPQVPDAATNTKWQRYVWLRVAATTVLAYIWNPNGVSDPTYLKWIAITQIQIPAGSIINSMLTANCVNDGNIHDVTWGKLTGGGSAGGDLTGIYPNPTIAAGAITNSKLGDGSITHSKFGALAVQPVTDMQPSATPLQQLRVNAAATAFEFFRPVTILQRVVSSLAAYSSIAAVIPADDTIPQVGEGTQLFTSNFTPLSNVSTIRIDALVNMYISGVAPTLSMFLDGAANAIAAVIVSDNGGGGGMNQNIAFSYEYASTDTAAHVLSLRAGTSNGATAIKINGSGASRLLGGVMKSWFKITEYL